MTPLIDLDPRRMFEPLFKCPVCGYPALKSKPYDTWPPPEGIDFIPPYANQLGRASYDGCPQCGYEFGNDDDPGTAAPTSFEEYRRQWESSGRPWFSSREPRPAWLGNPPRSDPGSPRDER
jgi:rubredoxin